MIKTELASLRSSVARLLGSGHPALDTIAKYYFQAEGKHIRPQIVLLMARATNGLSPIWPQLLHRSRSESGIESAPISPNNILNDYNPHDFQHRQTIATPSTDLLPTQRRLAEITEMIHVASLLHDDVIDEASLRRSAPSAPASFGNKLSILAGDFLLGRASVALARLRDNEVVELLATVIANLVEGEVMQLKGAPSASSGSSSRSPDDEVKESLAAFEQAMHIPQESASSSLSSSSSSSSSTEASPLSSFLTFDPLAATPSTRSPASSTSYPTGGPTREQFAHYLQKTYLKTASLIGKSARAATILGGCGVDAVDRFLGFLQNTKTSDAQVEQGKERCREIRDAAYWYGRNLGMAFQLVDDLLDFRTTSNMFGKPSGGADLQLGLATAPVLYAWQELGGESGLGDMVARKFEGPGDVAKALSLVQNSQALQRTSWLAEHYAEQARQALQVLPPSDAKEALITLTRQVTSRMK
ncbi:coq1 putative hexaprenyl diphosphate synthase [Tilletia horrida]|uniref:(2E,6E)-farnesyl diphosphate synthase n=1 Tax=Tilletia horrida TaxID=155126 RepID=A0AAN6JSX4_9BASI|nr:coq1 putative hexaprenyl diphosphate synthase [Tilletia horrida]